MRRLTVHSAYPSLRPSNNHYNRNNVPLTAIVRTIARVNCLTPYGRRIVPVVDQIKEVLYRIWCGANRLGDSGVHTLGDNSAFVNPAGQLLLPGGVLSNCIFFSVTKCFLFLVVPGNCFFFLVTNCFFFSTYTPKPLLTFAQLAFLHSSVSNRLYS